MRNDFVVFILCYGRPDNCYTYNTLMKGNYSGDWYIVCSSDDETVDEYRKKFGRKKVLVFDKNKVEFDSMDTFDITKCVVFARNICFDLAKKLGYRYFLELDDDYNDIQFRYEKNNQLLTKYYKDVDELFEVMIDLLNSSDKIYSVAFAQSGDYIGGINGTMINIKEPHKVRIRKCMNSFFCDTHKPFKFNGSFNEDVNTYTALQLKGPVFLTINTASIHQKPTQLTKGGMVDSYAEFGTYVKSFYSVMCCPSAVKISIMGDSYYRIHHLVKWNNVAPKIISDKYKKK